MKKGQITKKVQARRNMGNLMIKKLKDKLVAEKVFYEENPIKKNRK
jgi:hypothetical protein